MQGRQQRQLAELGRDGASELIVTHISEGRSRSLMKRFKKEQEQIQKQNARTKGGSCRTPSEVSDPKVVERVPERDKSSTFLGGKGG